MSPAELQALIRAERLRVPFLFLRDGDGAQQLIRLDEDRLVIGRMPGSELEISWDPRVSGVHAYLEQRGTAWVLEDDGLSRNGTFVNGERLRGQRTLRDGDVVTVGDTAIGYRLPQDRPLNVTVTTPTAAPPEVSDAQRRVLVALCRPLTRADSAAPATNEQISGELFLSLSAVKGHLRVLFNRFGLDEAPQNQKRLLLAERALHSMAVRPTDFE
jgi:pSer/pThr/pTyr-binding forkhead associated (FHA) protein